jgi:hypothetical protein
LAAVAEVVSAVVVEPPVLAVVDLAHLAVPAPAQVVARRAHRVQLPLLARLPVLAKAHLPVVAHLVEPAAPLQLLRSRRSFSAAMARSSP